MRAAIAAATLLTLVLVAAPTFATDPAPDANAPITVQARVDRSRITIGDPIRYTVEVSATADTEVMIPVFSGALGDFTISDFGELPTRKENGRIIT
ncbi:MAG TPA: hypothetical protein VF515_07610, partial [Candidatus Binatia bacterium]